jgi:NAD(P)H-dependent FMN reductase
MAKPRIGIILSTTRQNRFADKPAAWIKAIADKRSDAAFELVDLRDYPLPFFDEAMSPRFAPPKNEIAQRFGRKLDELDGFIFITAEYNHGIPAVLKNAIDYTYQQWHRKPAACVGYGGVGGARSIEQLRQVMVEVRAAPTPFGVNIGLVEFLGVWQQGKSFDDYPYLGDAANQMLDDIVWWTNALKAARETTARAAA